MELLKTQAELLRVKDVEGRFIVHFNETTGGPGGTSHIIHNVILFEFEGSRAASGAKEQDTLYSTKNVHTDEILCNVATHLSLCIDFKFTTVSSANAAIIAAECARVCQVMFDMSRNDYQNSIITTFIEKVHSVVVSEEVSVPVPVVQSKFTEGVSVPASIVQPERTKGVSVPPLLPIHVPEIMYRISKSELQIKAK